MPPQVLRACDWCHAKKIRCDRKDPCGPCRDNTVRCTRDRPRYPRQTVASASNDERFGALMHRLSSLEDALSSRSAESSSSARLAATNVSTPPVPSPAPVDIPVSFLRTESLSLGGEDGEQRQCAVPSSSSVGNGATPTRRKASSATSLDFATQTSQQGESPETPNNPVLKQAEHYFKIELGRSEWAMTQDSKLLFHSGLALARIVEPDAGAASFSDFALDQRTDFYSEGMHPSLAFLYATFNGLDSGAVVTEYYLLLGAHLSKSTLERMGLALVEKTVHGQRRLEFLVCVNFWAYLVLTSLESDHPVALMIQRLGGSRNKYLSNAKCALRRMSVMATPSATTLQALLSGVMLFLETGDFDTCWTLNSAACRACVALGGHYLSNQMSDSTSNEAAELRASLFYCYTFDKTFSVTMDRAFSLPEMEIKAASLVPAVDDQVSYNLCTILIELSQGMDAWLRERRTPGEGPDGAGKVNRLHRILESLEAVKERLDKTSQLLADESDSFLKGELMAMEFTYCSVRSGILGLVLAAGFDPDTHRARLETARRALVALKSMQDNAWIHCTRSMAFASSLTWTILIFPFSAFFAVFSNVVVTADLADLRLLKEISDGFTVVSIDSPTICRIEEFCKRLVRLCFDTISKPRLPNARDPAPFPQSLGATRSLHRSSAQDPTETTRGMGNYSAEPSMPSPLGLTGHETLFHDRNLQNVHFSDIFDGAARRLGLETNDEQFWQLFEAQSGGFAGVP